MMQAVRILEVKVSLHRIVSILLAMITVALFSGWTSAVAGTSQRASATQHVKPPPKPPVIKSPIGWPKMLYIPRLGVTAPVESIALDRPEDTHAPYKWSDVAWYDRGAKPGDPGNAAIFGHVDSTCCPAVFYKIQDLKAGDVIEVKYKSALLKFKVLWQNSYPNDHLPLKFMFGSFGPQRGLELITCTGIFHLSGEGYDHKRIVYARLLLPNGKLG
jgi:sortase (surface protein transpeptidase)